VFPKDAEIKKVSQKQKKKEEVFLFPFSPLHWASICCFCFMASHTCEKQESRDYPPGVYGNWRPRLEAFLHDSSFKVRRSYRNGNVLKAEQTGLHVNFKARND
jgi:hypothetical protein